MDRHPSILPRARAAIALVLLVTQTGFAADPLEKARALVKSGDPASAASLLESTLPGLPPDRRASIVAELRIAYEAAIRKAETAGRIAEASRYRDNLEILGRKPKTPNPPDAIVTKLVPIAKNSATITEMPDTPSAPPVRERPTPRDDSGVVDSNSDPSEASATPPEVSDALPEAPPRDATVDRAGLIKTVGDEPRSAEKEESEPRISEGAPPSSEPRDDLASADEAFRARRFEDAGRIYTSLAKSRLLPEARRDVWAYCRCHEVVRRINDGPTSSEDWSAIRGEIEQIRKLSPKLWYAEYLRNLAAERSNPKTKPPSKRPVLRGASPEEPEPTSTPKPTTGSIGMPGKSENGWKVFETKNFRILHLDDTLAEKTAVVAESSRDSHIRRWTGAPPADAWAPKCDLYLYPTANDFRKATGQADESPGFSTMGMNAGKVVDRRITLRADNPRLLTAVLPHEVTHVVLADLFPTSQIPRWADEGVSVLSEPPTDQRLRDADLSQPLSKGQVFRVQDLMVMDYPEGEHWGVYYAQSVSLTRFLVERGTPPKFIKFVQDSRRNGIETELRRSYGIDGFAQLQELWQEHARSRITSLAAKEEGGKSR